MDFCTERKKCYIYNAPIDNTAANFALLSTLSFQMSDSKCQSETDISPPRYLNYSEFATSTKIELH